MHTITTCRTTGAVTAVMIIAALGVLTPAPAHADCGNPGQTPCTGPVPSTDQIVAVMAELTDPDIPAANKTNIVTPGFSPDEAGTIDDHLNRMRHRSLPLNFVVSDIQPAANSSAGATLATVGGSVYQRTNPRPIVLVDQGGHWLINHDSAVAELDVFWRAASRHVAVVP
jgi:hypothetical protein